MKDVTTPQVVALVPQTKKDADDVGLTLVQALAWARENQATDAVVILRNHKNYITFSVFDDDLIGLGLLAWGSAELQSEIFGAVIEGE